MMIIEDFYMHSQPNAIYLIIKIIRSLMKKLNLVIMDFKNGNEGDELIFTMLEYEITILPFRRQPQILTSKIYFNA